MHQQEENVLLLSLIWMGLNATATEHLLSCSSRLPGPGAGCKPDADGPELWNSPESRLDTRASSD